MKFTIDDRVKHRIIGVFVLVAVAVIFLPAVMKKSNYRFDEHISLSVRIPKNPALPQVAMVGDKEMFKSVKVAHVDIPAVNTEPRLVATVKAEPISVLPQIKPEPTLAMVEKIAKSAPKKLTPKLIVATKNTAPPAAIAKQVTGYAVQLASFAQQSNAQSLVTQLRKKGYSATYQKISSKQGDLYKVIVGQLKEKTEASKLQKTLAVNMQLNGFVVKTGVS